MEFWGVEVKAGQSLSVKPESYKYLHLSQATLGEIKKDKANESVTVLLKIGDQKLVLGILSPEKFPHLPFDLVFEKEFELSHNWKNGSVYFCGYQSYGEDQENEEHLDSDSGSEEDKCPCPMHPAENGKPSHKEKSTANKFTAVKPESSKKPNVKLPEPIKEEDGKSEDDDESDDDESDEDMLGSDSSDTDDEDDKTESYEETPKKVESAKKRLNEASKTPVPAKKAKPALPEKTDGKKGGHMATPHPAKKPVKTPNIGQAKTETPKSGGQFSCKSCERSFGSDDALQSHNKAKHGSK